MKYFFDINKLPINWKIVRADGVLDSVKNSIRVDTLKDKLFFHYSIPAIQETGDGKVENGNEIDSDKILLEGGEILISKLNPEKGTVILTKKNSLPIISSPELVPLKPKNGIKEKYAYYVFASDGIRDFLSSKAQSATKSHKRVDPSEIIKIWIPLPSIQIQEKIITKLDFELENIDKLISFKEKLLLLLSEKHQSLISQTVTKGINSKIKLRDSGIYWLGEIPEHWNIKRIKHITNKIGSGVTPRGGAEVYSNEGIPLLRSQNIHFDGLKLSEVAFISEEIHNSMSGSKVEYGDVLLNITGASIGRCFYFLNQFEEANVNQHVCIIRPNEKVLTKYLYYYLMSDWGQNQIAVNQVGGGREGLNSEELKSFIVPLPSISEQHDIINALKEQTDKIDKLKEATNRSIDLLKERRKALISEAVTGQLEIS
jgi:type I restriction enzyme S subunit